jgi:hypothetical protein
LLLAQPVLPPLAVQQKVALPLVPPDVARLELWWAGHLEPADEAAHPQGVLSEAHWAPPAGALPEEQSELPLEQRALVRLVSEPLGPLARLAQPVLAQRGLPPETLLRVRLLELARGAAQELPVAQQVPPGAAQARPVSPQQAYLELQAWRLVVLRQTELLLAASARPWQPPLWLLSLSAQQPLRQLPLPPVRKSSCESFPQRLPEWSSSVSSFP